MLHSPGFDLDLLHIAGDKWSGRVHRKEFDSHVTLIRPGYGAKSEEGMVRGYVAIDGRAKSELLTFRAKRSG
jgi:hypothetical protein